jgi:ankyrin repeat protein
MKKLVYLVALLWFSFASAGSYEDFFRAIKRDDAKEVSALLARGFDPNTVDPKGLHGLYLALQEPSPRVAEVLADWPKTNLEWRSPKDETALMIAALRGHVALARKLVEKGADVNKPGWTPLHYAATSGQLEIIDLLLENHAYIDAESPNKTTPLMMAAHYGTREAVKLLLQAGADPTLKNELGLSAIDFAYRADRKDVAEMIAAAIRAQGPQGKW